MCHVVLILVTNESLEECLLQGMEIQKVIAVARSSILRVIVAQETEYFRKTEAGSLAFEFVDENRTLLMLELQSDAFCQRMEKVAIGEQLRRGKTRD